VRLPWQGGGVCGAMMRLCQPQPVASPALRLQGQPGARGKYGGSNANRNQILCGWACSFAGPALYM